jgi:hypothetical protein
MFFLLNSHDPKNSVIYCHHFTSIIVCKGPSWLYGSWIYNYLCNQCLSPLKLWVWILLMVRYIWCIIMWIVCQWLATGRWFSLCTPLSSTNKTDRHDITEILLKVALNTITHPPPPSLSVLCQQGHPLLWIYWAKRKQHFFFAGPRQNLWFWCDSKIQHDP